MPTFRDGPTLRESIGMKVALVVTCFASLAAIYGAFSLIHWICTMLPAPGEY